MQKLVTVVIPAFNEAQAIGGVLEDLKAKCPDVVDEIIVVDDGSTDETAKVAEKAGVTVKRHPRNLGYGAALKTGIRAAGSPFVLTMDADGQHRSEHVLRVWEAAEGGDVDMVVGERTTLIHSPLWRMPGKWLLGFMANRLTKRRIADLNSGLRLVRRDVALKYLHLCPSGFSFSTTITLALLSRGYSVLYVPIQVGRRVGKSLVSLGTGLETIVLVLRIATLFNPLRIFVPASVLIGLMGVVWGTPFALVGRGVSVGSMLAIVTSVLLLGIGLLCDQISQLRLERFE